MMIMWWLIDDVSTIADDCTVVGQLENILRSVGITFTPSWKRHCQWYWLVTVCTVTLDYTSCGNLIITNGWALFLWSGRKLFWTSELPLVIWLVVIMIYMEWILTWCAFHLSTVSSSFIAILLLRDCVNNLSHVSGDVDFVEAVQIHLDTACV